MAGRPALPAGAASVVPAGRVDGLVGGQRCRADMPGSGGLALMPADQAGQQARASARRFVTSRRRHRRRSCRLRRRSRRRRPAEVAVLADHPAATLVAAEAATLVTADPGCRRRRISSRRNSSACVRLPSCPVRSRAGRRRPRRAARRTGADAAAAVTAAVAGPYRDRSRGRSPDRGRDRSSSAAVPSSGATARKPRNTRPHQRHDHHEMISSAMPPNTLEPAAVRTAGCGRRAAAAGTGVGQRRPQAAHRRPTAAV